MFWKRMTNFWLSKVVERSWIEIHFLSMKIEVSSYRLKVAPNLSDRPVGFQLEGSNDGYSWAPLDSRIDVFKESNDLLFNCQYGGTFSYFRFTQTFPTYFGSWCFPITAFDFYGKPWIDRGKYHLSRLFE